MLIANDVDAVLEDVDVAVVVVVVVVAVEDDSILDNGSLSGRTVSRFFGSRNRVRSTSICRFSRSELFDAVLVVDVEFDEVLVELLLNNGAF